MSQSYLFFFGGYPHLSAAELQFLVAPWQSSPITLSSHIHLLNHLSASHLHTLQTRLGGVTKIARLVRSHLDPDNLKSELVKLIHQSPRKNVALTNYSPWLRLSPAFAADLKRLTGKRFLNFSLRPPSLVALRKQDVLELSLVPTKDHSLIVGETIWIQNSEEWIKRDRQRPYQDIKRGMLPPKIARIMVNLATAHQSQGLLADPFCGTGTIPLEAASLGYDVFASDLDPQAVNGTRTNLVWLQQSFSLNFQFRTQILDATHLNQALTTTDFIVTEPFMGQLLDKRHLPSPQKLKNIIKGLHKLYLGALKNWQPLLSEQGRVVIIFPQFHLFGQTQSLPLIDTCEKLGYNKLAQLTYSKPQAKIVRQILVLQKT